MAREVSTNGRKKVATLMKEFNANFPYLRIRFYRPEGKPYFDKGSLTEYRIDINKTLAEVRLKKGNGEISFTGSKNVSTIEREFEAVFGLFVQICYTTKDGDMYYTTGEENKQSLTQLNRQKAAEGCQKDQWS
jgi:hypothetical protein